MATAPARAGWRAGLESRHSGSFSGLRPDRLQRPEDIDRVIVYSLQESTAANRTLGHDDVHLMWHHVVHR